VKNKSQTTSIGHTHQNSVDYFCLCRILFGKSCLRRILFHEKNVACGAFFSYICFFLNHSVVHLISNSLICLPIHSWRKWFGLQYSVNTTTQFVPNINEQSVKQLTLCQTKPCEIQIAQHQFQVDSKTIYKKQCSYT